MLNMSKPRKKVLRFEDYTDKLKKNQFEYII